MKNLEKFLEFAYPIFKLLLMMFLMITNQWTITLIMLFLFVLATFCTDLIVRAIKNPKNK
jgi:hypothetical protein